ncbi:MAG: hypothetical protein NT041_02270, partial [Candidatus Vogelbacteria bacterium]|nr:hypothetical protein [Candidatus Vogelbacteria bacterium]
CSGVWEKVRRGNYLDSYTVSCGDAGFSSKTYRIKRNSQESRVYLVKVVNEEVANAKPIPDETITNIISTLEFTK